MPEREGYWKRWSSICFLIQGRPWSKQMIIDKRMLDVCPEHMHHPYFNRTFLPSVPMQMVGWQGDFCVSISSEVVLMLHGD